MRILICGLLSLLLIGCVSPPPLVVGSDLGNRPFAFFEGGQPGGFEPELVQALAKELGRPVEWKRLDFGQLIDAVVAGEIDVACATMGITPERAERVAFSEPYYETEISVVVPAASPLLTIADLSGRRVGAGRGTTSERAVRVHAPSALVVLDRKENVSWGDMLAAGQLHAAAMDGPDAQRMVAAEPARYRRLGALSSERYAMAISYNSTELVEAVNRALLALKKSGHTARLLEQHAIPPSIGRR